jgi:hypothetical protein
MVKRATAVCIFAALASPCARPLPAQRADRTLSPIESKSLLIQALVRARAEVMRDTTRIVGCGVKRLLGGQSDFRSLLDSATRAAVGSCVGAGVKDSAAAQQRDVVEIESFELSGDSATVVLFVLYGDLGYRQSMRFGLNVPPGGSSARPYWKLRSTSIKDFLDIRRFYGIPPGLS